MLTACYYTAFGQRSAHTCGAADIHNNAISYGQVSDIDGNTYKTVVIDNLVWFAENLKVTRFQNGDVIPNVSDSATWATLSSAGMCSYQNDTSYDCPYGKLYNFFVASDARNPCPIGWRVPSKNDYDSLVNYFDPDANGGVPGSLPNSAGGFLKSTGLSYWLSPNTAANNQSGFSAIPNGGRNNQGVFSFTGNTAASYWYSSQVGPGMGFFLQLPYNQEFAVRNAYFDRYGCCIRCVTDLSTLNINESHRPEFNVYPNPADAFIKVHADHRLIGKAFVITDFTGRQLREGKMLAEDMMISLDEFPGGMYFLSFPSSGLGVSKIIKQ